MVVWFVGLSGAGKTTIVRNLELELTRAGRLCYVFDGDIIRRGLSRDLGFSAEDRKENLRRSAETVKICADIGVACLASFISPLSSDRAMICDIIGPERFIEVFVKCPVEVCEQRDPKGLYRLAREGVIKDFTGISADFEAPDDPHLVLETSVFSVRECVDKVLAFLRFKQHGLIREFSAGESPRATETVFMDLPQLPEELLKV